MQSEPTAPELLEVVAEVLRDEVVPALEGATQHHARVAASIVDIVRRELLLAPASDEVELADLRRRLGDDSLGLRDARAGLAASLRGGAADDPDEHRALWDELVAVVERDLAVAKPGHADWTEG